MSNSPRLRPPAFGIALLIAGGMVLGAVDASIKLISPTIPVGEIMFIRGCFTLIGIAALAVARGGFSAVRAFNYRDQFIRAGCFVAGTFLFIEALWRLPLAEANAISFLGPVLVTAMAPFTLREQVGWRRWFTVLIGFAGVVLMLRPSASGIEWAALFPLGAAFTSAYADIVTRRLSATDSAVSILFFTTLAVVLVGLATLPFGWQPLDGFTFAIIAGVGTFVFAAHWLIVEAFRLAEAAVLAPFKYLMLIWALIIGYFGWGEVPDGWAAVGGAAIVVSGLLLFRSATQRAQQAVVL